MLPDNITEIKELLYDSGALSVGCYSEGDYFSPYYHVAPGEEDVRETKDEETGAVTRYYSPNCWTYDPDNVNGAGTQSLIANHDVTIVGWDDSYSRWNFATPLLNANGTERYYDPEIAEVQVSSVDGERYIVPLMDGAWLIKNSYGATWTRDDTTSMEGNDGLYWFSYCEKTLTDFATLAPVEESDKARTVQQYDGTYPSALHSESAEEASLQFANVFTPESNAAVDAVSTWTTETDSTVTIKVYTDLANPNDPESGTLALLQSVLLPQAGWHTIDLEKAANVDEGEPYSVVANIQSDSPGKTTATFPIECSTDYTPTVIYIGAGESFLQELGENGELIWVDLYDTNQETNGAWGNVALKAYEIPREDGGDEPSGPGGPDEQDNPDESDEPDNPNETEDPGDEPKAETPGSQEVVNPSGNGTSAPNTTTSNGTTVSQGKLTLIRGSGNAGVSNKTAANTNAANSANNTATRPNPATSIIQQSESAQPASSFSSNARDGLASAASSDEDGTAEASLPATNDSFALPTATFGTATGISGVAALLASLAILWLKRSRWHGAA